MKTCLHNEVTTFVRRHSCTYRGEDHADYLRPARAHARRTFAGEIAGRALTHRTSLDAMWNWITAAHGMRNELATLYPFPYLLSCDE